MMKTSKDIRDLVDKAQEQDWRVEDRGNTLLLLSPDGKTIVTIHQTPSDRNWRKQAERQMKKGGYEP
jgi:hypothetical protein